MKVNVRVTKSFKTAAKPLFKKYPSLIKELLTLEKDLQLNPRMGTPLGQGVYKIRIKISSKGRGKSGGARVISMVETNVIGVAEKLQDCEIVVNLLTIYDKSDTASISDSELKELLNSINI